MITPFGFGNLLLLKKLERRGTPFGLQRTLTHPLSPFWRAVSSLVSLHESSVQTYVVRETTDGRQLYGVAQVYHRQARPEAEIIYLAPSLSGQPGMSRLWGRLLTHVCKQAGARGIQRLFASAPWGEEETRIFKEVGFMVYAREDILRLDQPAAVQHDSSVEGLRRLRVEDEGRLQELYYQVTPRRVQWAEGQLSPPTWSVANNRGMLWGEEAYVLEDARGVELSAFLQIVPGNSGHWLELTVVPGTCGYADQLVSFGLERMADWPAKPIYAAVREYQAGVLPALQAVGFEPFARQGILVKHTTVPIKDPLVKFLPAIEKRVGPSTPTVTMLNNEPVSESAPRPVAASAGSVQK